MQPGTDHGRQEWFEDESFWEEFYPVLFPDILFEEAEEEIEKILDLIGHPVSSILDLCCGPGRFAGLLARDGYQVCGVDRTPFLLDKARTEYSDCATAEWVLSDMREFVRPDAFDLILNLYTSFGYFEDPADERCVLNNIHTSLRPGGSFIIEVMGKEILARDFEPVLTSQIDDGFFIQVHEIRENWNRIYNEWTLVRNGTVRTFPFEHTLFAASDLVRLCEMAGFTDIRVFGDFDGSPYDNTARLLIVTGKKG